MAVKTKAELVDEANVIRDETAIGGNTKLRVRNMIVNMIDSFSLLLDIVTPSTAGGTITFDFALKQKRTFWGFTSFATAKTIAFANDSEAKEFDFVLNITSGSAILTFPSTVLMTDSRWEVTGAKQWQPNAAGSFKGHAVFDGTNWLVDISQEVYV